MQVIWFQSAWNPQPWLKLHQILSLSAFYKTLLLWPWHWSFIIYLSSNCALTNKFDPIQFTDAQASLVVMMLKLCNRGIVCLLYLGFNIHKRLLRLSWYTKRVRIINYCRSLSYFLQQSNSQWENRKSSDVKVQIGLQKYVITAELHLRGSNPELCKWPDYWYCRRWFSFNKVGHWLIFLNSFASMFCYRKTSLISF